MYVYMAFISVYAHLPEPSRAALLGRLDRHQRLAHLGCGQIIISLFDIIIINDYTYYYYYHYYH